jgi:hypothetical protein
MSRGWIGCVLALALVGCSSASVKVGHLPASSLSNLYTKCTIGKSVTIFDANPPPGFTIGVVMTVAQHTTATSPGAVSPSAGEYEVASVSITGRKGSYPYAASNFKFVIGDHKYPATDADAAKAFGPPLGQGTLTAGHSVHGTVAFDVPTGGGHVGIRDVRGLEICGWAVPK